MERIFSKLGYVGIFAGLVSIFGPFFGVWFKNQEYYGYSINNILFGIGFIIAGYISLKIANSCK